MPDHEGDGQSSHEDISRVLRPPGLKNEFHVFHTSAWKRFPEHQAGIHPEAWLARPVKFPSPSAQQFSDQVRVPILGAHPIDRKERVHRIEGLVAGDHEPDEPGFTARPEDVDEFRMAAELQQAPIELEPSKR